MREDRSKKDKIEILLLKVKIKIGKFMKTKFGRYLWQFVSSALILLVAGGIGVFAAFAQTEGSPTAYAKDYFEYFMTHSWSLMYAETDLEDSKYINETTFQEMMKNIVPSRGSDQYEFIDRGSDDVYHVIDVVYQETGSDVKQTMTLYMKKQEEKELLILNQWKVCLTDQIIQNCTINVPADMSVIFDGVSLADCTYTDNLETGIRTYTLDKVLPGKHKIELSGAGTKSVYETFYWEGSRSSYTVQATDLPLDDTVSNTCSDQAIDMVIGMYTGVLTNGGCDAVKNFLTTEEEKAAIDELYAKLLSQVNREDGTTLITMSFDSYDTAIIDYVYGRSFGIKFTFGTTFTAKEARTQMSGVRDSYDATAQGEAVVRFECREGQWVPVRMEMDCFDYSKPPESVEE